MNKLEMRKNIADLEYKLQEETDYTEQLKNMLAECDAALKESRANDMETMRQFKQFEWQPIETAPIWVSIIVYDKNASRQKSCKEVFCAVQVEKGKWELTTKLGKINPTHWMPLPPAP